MAKNCQVHESGKKVGRSNATPTKFFAVDSYDLKSLSLKFGNDTFITFEMSRVSYKRPVGKMNISLLFRPSVIRGPWPISILTLFQDKPSNFNQQPFSAHIPMTSCNKIFSLPLCIRSIKIAHNHCSPMRVAAIWKCIYSLNNNWWDLG